MIARCIQRDRPGGQVQLVERDFANRLGIDLYGKRGRDVQVRIVGAEERRTWLPVILRQQFPVAVIKQAILV
jgi:hypothetical protein